MFVTGLGTTVPPYRYTQRDCWAAMQTAQQFLNSQIVHIESWRRCYVETMGSKSAFCPQIPG